MTQPAAAHWAHIANADLQVVFGQYFSEALRYWVMLQILLRTGTWRLVAWGVRVWV